MEKIETQISNKPVVSFFEKRWVHIGLIIPITFGVYANSFKFAKNSNL